MHPYLTTTRFVLRGDTPVCFTVRHLILGGEDTMVLATQMQVKQLGP